METSSIERAIAKAQRAQEHHFDLARTYDAATTALKEAEDAQVDAWKAALRDGWTPADLKRLGLPAPNRSRRHARPKSAGSEPASDAAETVAADEVEGL